MTRSRTRFTVLVAMLSALLLAVPAWASSGFTINSFSTTTNSAGQPVGVSADITTSDGFDWLILDFDDAIEFTAPGDPGAPADGEVVGEVSLRAALVSSLCLRMTHVATLRWVTPGGSAPGSPDVRAQGSSTTGQFDVEVVQDNGAYELRIDASAAVPCSANPTMDWQIWTDSHSATSNAVVARNNSTPDTYTITVTLESATGTHAESFSYIIT